MAESTRGFRIAMGVGIAANLAFALPTLVAPAAALRLAGLPAASPIVWPQVAGLLLSLLSVFYLPAAVDPDRYRLIAWLAVGARLAGVAFFLGVAPAAYHQFGYFDLAFFVPQLALLVRLPPAGAHPRSVAGVAS
ncbi:MAG: hypothetical protein AB7O28_12400 [Vicinamibacterales bacterium]